MGWHGKGAAISNERHLSEVEMCGENQTFAGVHSNAQPVNASTSYWEALFDREPTEYVRPATTNRIIKTACLAIALCRDATWHA